MLTWHWILNDSLFDYNNHFVHKYVILHILFIIIFKMIEEPLELRIRELDMDYKLNLLFSGVMGVAPAIPEENKHQPKE